MQVGRITFGQKLYDDRDPAKLGEFYVAHVSAMTTEKLHGKADIAAELAHRDSEIARLTAVLERIADTECHAEQVCDCKRRLALEALSRED